jgi:hypothetical protein
MNTYVLVSRKDRMKCPVCGDLRIGRKKAPARYRGKMKYNEAKGKMVCEPVYRGRHRASRVLGT